MEQLLKTPRHGRARELPSAPQQTCKQPAATDEGTLQLEGATISDNRAHAAQTGRFDVDGRPVATASEPATKGVLAPLLPEPPDSTVPLALPSSAEPLSAPASTPTLAPSVATPTAPEAVPLKALQFRRLVSRPHLEVTVSTPGLHIKQLPGLPRRASLVSPAGEPKIVN